MQFESPEEVGSYNYVINSEQQEPVYVASETEESPPVIIPELPKAFDFRRYLTFTKVLHHFVIGFLSAWMGASLLPILGFHLGWEIFTNSAFGRDLGRRFFYTDWSDRSWQESVCDNVLFVAGYLAAKFAVTMELIPGKLTDMLG